MSVRFSKNFGISPVSTRNPAGVSSRINCFEIRSDAEVENAHAGFPGLIDMDPRSSILFKERLSAVRTTRLEEFVVEVCLSIKGGMN